MNVNLETLPLLYLLLSCRIRNCHLTKQGGNPGQCTKCFGQEAMALLIDLWEGLDRCGKGSLLPLALLLLGKAEANSKHAISFTGEEGQARTSQDKVDGSNSE